MAVKGNFLRTWVDAVSKPRKTFAGELKKKRSLIDGAFHLLIAAVVSAIVIGLFPRRLAVELQSFISATPALGSLFWFILVLSLIIISIITWLIFSGILYLIARLLNGKGNFTQQSYLIAIYSAPVTIATSIIALGGQIGNLINLVISVYSLYLLTVALGTTHKYSTGRAVLTWLIPLLVVLVLVVIGFLTLSLLGLPG